MIHFHKTLDLAASAAAVYDALATAAGLRGWWTHDCEIQTHVGGTNRFRFGPNHKEMRIQRLEPGREVAWLCVGAHIAAGQLSRRDEWIGTQLVFRISPQVNRSTRLEFEHIGLVPAFECFGMCCGAWEHFLGSLRLFVETGRGTPHLLQAALVA